MAKKTYDAASYFKAPAKKSIYEDDSRIFHNDRFRFEHVVKTGAVRASAAGVEIETVSKDGTAGRMILSAPDEHVLRLRFLRSHDTGREVPDMPATDPAPRVSMKLRESDACCELRLGARRIIIGKNPFSFAVEDDTRTILEFETERLAGNPPAPPLGFRHTAGGDAQPFLSVRIRNDERFFGLGEKWNKVEKTSTRATVWATETCGSNTTDLSYQPMPVLLSTRGYGMFLNTNFRSLWEVGTFSYTAASCLTEDPELDLFFFFGGSLKDLVSRYTALTGRPSMPPRWALGLWASRCMYESRAEAEEIINRLRAEKIPCDVINLDPKWMNTHYYFKIGVDACDFVRNEKAFPDQPDMFARFLEQGINTCLWVNPYLPENTPVFNEAAQKGFLLKSTQGGFARLTHGEPVGMVDFFNPAAREWWKDFLRELVREGASVFKADYGDRVPEDALSYDGRTGRELHNPYTREFTAACYEVVKEINGTGMVWRRPGYTGSQRFPGTWAGDTQVSWEAMRCCLRGGLSLGFTGEAFWTHDIGGFVGKMPSPELYIRWAQFGLLAPLSRFHGAGGPREPWFYGDEALRIFRSYAQLRYRLIPWLLAQAGHACETGIPIMRHMALEFPDEPNSDTLDDQYMLGDALLAAPVMLDGARQRPVYLPQGTWFSWYRPDEPVAGGRFIRAAAPLARIPLFARAGSVIPCYAKPPQHLKGPAANELVIECFAGRGARRLQFEEGGRKVALQARLSASGGTLTLRGFTGRVTVRVHGMIVKKAGPGVHIDKKNNTLRLDAPGSMKISFAGSVVRPE